MLFRSWPSPSFSSSFTGNSSAAPAAITTVSKMIRVPEAKEANRGIHSRAKLAAMETTTTPRITLLFREAGMITARNMPYSPTLRALTTLAGSKLNSNFKDEDVTDSMSEIQPGDSITLHVQLTNQDSSNTDWYMTNEVLQTLEDAQDSASGAAYEYRLTYVDSKNKETVLYDSSTVGGEGSSTAGEGLKQADASLDEYFYLGRLAKGESGTVYLKVGVEGETGNNGYQQTLAKLRMTFAVEKVKEGQTIKKNTVIEKKVPQKNNLTTSRKAVKTGDTSNLLMYSVIGLVGGLIFLIAGIILLNNSRKTRQHREGEN